MGLTCDGPSHPPSTPASGHPSEDPSMAASRRIHLQGAGGHRRPVQAPHTASTSPVMETAGLWPGEGGHRPLAQPHGRVIETGLGVPPSALARCSLPAGASVSRLWNGNGDSTHLARSLWLGFKEIRASRMDPSKHWVTGGRGCGHACGPAWKRATFQMCRWQ